MKRLLVVIVSLLLLCGCNIKTDAIRFKEEYESLNGLSNENDLEYFKLDIPENNNVVYMADSNDVVYQLTHGTHIIYFGFKDCPWCRQIIPLLLETSSKFVGIKIYYFDFKELRNNYIEDKNVEEYESIMEIIGDFNEYQFDPVRVASKLMAPTVLFIKNGEIVACHIGTVPTHTNGYVLLTEDEKEEISGIYKAYIELIISENQGCKECN